ncbi:class I SAM-dependent methyltransferase [Halobacteriovorax marinus]|uniref:class I SAM-dependent methyltransferase n=1 Tax=Halobacteriovorax marinus TaxID=97084 RepID=UPI003A8FB644
MEIQNSCFNCTNNESVLYKEVGKYKVVKCSSCGLVYLDKYPSDLFNFIDDIENESEEDLEFWSTPDFINKYKSIFDFFMEERGRRLRKCGYSFEGHTLDIGVGYGLWANFLHQNKLQVRGIDVSKSTVEYCKQEYDFEVENRSFERFETEDRYSLISMFDVLEHFEDPVLMMSKVKSMLTDDGFIYIQVPNVLGFKIPRNHSLGLPYHLWQFDKKRLFRLLEKSGFEVVSYWTGIQGIIGAYEKNEVSIFTRMKWKISNILKLGNRIQVIAKLK